MFLVLLHKAFLCRTLENIKAIPVLSVTYNVRETKPTGIGGSLLFEADFPFTSAIGWNGLFCGSTHLTAKVRPTLTNVIDYDLRNNDVEFPVHIDCQGKLYCNHLCVSQYETVQQYL